MLTLTTAARTRLGTRAATYVEMHGTHSTRGRPMVPSTDAATPGVERTLDRVYGRATTRDRGEVAYWDVPASDVVADAE